MGKRQHTQFLQNGKDGNEVDEGYEGHEDEVCHEGHEEDGYEEVHRCQGKAWQVLRLPRNQGENQRWIEEVRLEEEQERKGGFHQGFCKRKEGVQAHFRMDQCLLQGSQDPRNQGIPGHWRKEQSWTGSLGQGSIL